MSHYSPATNDGRGPNNRNSNNHNNRHRPYHGGGGQYNSPIDSRFHHPNDRQQQRGRGRGNQGSIPPRWKRPKNHPFNNNGNPKGHSNQWNNRNSQPDEPPQPLMMDPRDPSIVNVDLDSHNLNDMIPKNDNDNNSEDGDDANEFFLYQDGNPHNELNIRLKTLENLLAIDSMEERLNMFAELSLEDQQVLCLPDDVSKYALPPLDIPLDWDLRMNQAVTHTVDIVKSDIFRKRGADERFSDSDSAYSSDGMYGSRNFTGKDDQDYAVLFVRQLPYCHPLTLGFHTVDAFSKWCYCPCGPSMARWRKFTGMEKSFLDETTGPQCKFKGKKTPFELIKHIQKKKEECKVHLIMYEYLSFLFLNYHAPDVRHIGFEDKGTKEYRKAAALVARKTQGLIDGLKTEIAKKRDIEAKLKKAEEEMENLKRNNRDLANKLEMEQELKLKYKARQEQQFTVQEAQRARRNFDHFRDMARNSIVNAATTSTSGREAANVKKQVLMKHPTVFLESMQEFDITQEFHVWYSMFLSYEKGGEYNQEKGAEYCYDHGDEKKLFPHDIPFPLFTDITSETSHRTATRNNLWLITKWDVCITNSNIVMSKSMKKESTAVDEGGPTREFFNRIWLQLGDLAIYRSEDDPKKIQLFVQEGETIVPQTNEMLEYALRGMKKVEKMNMRTKIKRYYRAVGRIMAHCLLLSKENYGPIPIALHALPNFYRTILLRGLDVEKEEYCLGLLIEHALELFDLQLITTKSGQNTLTERLGITEDESDHDDSIVRQRIKEIYVDSRSIAVDALKEGIELNGVALFPVCFGFVPTSTLTQIAFGQLTPTYDIIFNEDGQFRFIQFVGDYNGKIKDKTKAAILQDTQSVFKEGMKKLFEDKVKNEPSFIVKFVHLCTGQSFIPDTTINVDFKINVEFNHSEMNDDNLPVVHTCDNCIKIPANAYDADMEKFEMKVRKTIDLTAGSFDMK